MLIVALVLAVIGLAALVTAVVTSNELIAWVCIGASVIGVLLLIVDALRERSRGDESDEDVSDSRDAQDHETTVLPAADADAGAAEDYPEDEKPGATQVLTPHEASREQAVDPAHGEVSPETTRE